MNYLKIYIYIHTYTGCFTDDFHYNPICQCLIFLAIILENDQTFVLKDSTIPNEIPLRFSRKFKFLIIQYIHLWKMIDSKSENRNRYTKTSIIDYLFIYLFITMLIKG